MRGEHSGEIPAPRLSGGSSPHARGALLLLGPASAYTGIIPACAGSTAPRRSSPSPTWDHPRMRGEHKIEGKSRKTDGGSSPHARGAPHFRPELAQDAGIIPACAGSTVGLRRVRGVGEGSSPHARGALVQRVPRQVRDGIIPACAGSTPCAPARRSRPGDHPRMRGEHTLCQPSAGEHAGSSPHARGAHRGRRADGRPSGIIPACAGSTLPSPSSTTDGRDHPRMRGEHPRVMVEPETELGSSPHARGAPVYGFGLLRREGIIPACAGSTTARTSGAASTRDHPRMRGEHPRRVLIAGRVHGIIPACAGSTVAPVPASS